MSQVPDPIWLSFPARKYATGLFCVSEDYEILIAFKDCGAVYAPRLSLSPLNQSINPQLQFFCIPQFKKRSAIRFDSESAMAQISPEKYEIGRQVAAICDKNLLAQDNKALEAKDFLNYHIRAFDWSPSGADTFGRCVFACISSTHRLFVFQRIMQQWQVTVDISGLWFETWLNHGGEMLSQAHRGFTSPVDQWNPKAENDPALFDEKILCKSVEDYCACTIDTAFLQVAWSASVRTSRQNMCQSSRNCPLIALHKSGTISFWDFRFPCTTWKSVRLLGVDRTHMVIFDPSAKMPRPNSLEVLDFNADDVMLISGFTDGRILAIFYKIFCVGQGKLAMSSRNTLVLSEPTDDRACVLAASFCPKGEIVCVAVGSKILAAHIHLKPTGFSTHAIRVFTPDGVLKPITGVHITNKNVYFASADGHLSVGCLNSSLSIDQFRPILWKSSNPPLVHRNWCGLFVSPNEVHAIILEIANVPTACDANSYITFVSLMPTQLLTNRIVAIVQNVSEDAVRMHRRIDLFHELNRQLKSTESMKQIVTGDALNSVFQPFTTLFVELNNLTSADLSKMPVPSLQMYRNIYASLAKSWIPNGRLRESMSELLRKLDFMLAMFQLERTLRLFLKPEIQRQANDCKLVLNIARFCVSYLDSPQGSERCPPSLTGSLKRAAGAVAVIASKLYTQRFGKLHHELTSISTLACIVCNTKVKPHIDIISCENGHRLPRCCHCFEACSEPIFYACPECKRNSIFLHHEDRPSQWRKEVNTNRCPYCDVLLTLVV